MKVVSTLEVITASGEFDRDRVRGILDRFADHGQGELFFAIKGDRFDGHDFVAAALDRGAQGAVVAREFAGSGVCWRWMIR